MMKKYAPLFFAMCFSYCLLACAGNTAANNSNGNNRDSSKENVSAVTGSGSDYYYEITTNTHSAEISVNLVLKMFLSAGGNVRTEMTTSGLPGGKDKAPIVLLGTASNTSQSTIIDDAAKTYTRHHIDAAEKLFDKQVKSNAVKVGVEKIGNYNCVHARIITTRNMGPLGNLIDTIETWKSNEVPLPVLFKKWMDEFETKTGGSMYSLETVKQLEQMGCTGFPVKLRVNGKSSTMLMHLAKTERRDFPASFFEIPAGYTENKSDDF